MNRGFFMHNRGRYFVQQGSAGAGGGASPFSFTDPTFNVNNVVVPLSTTARAESSSAETLPR
jgi:hypothetical protein